MKKIVAVEIVVLLLASFIYFNFKKEPYEVETKVMDICTQPVIYSREKGRNIYTYCLESIQVREKNKTVELKDMDSGIEILLNHLTITESLDDGGTTIYKDTKRITKNGLTVIACNTLTGNHDIYIGPENLQLQENFCKFDENMAEDKNFTKTYHVYHVAESNDYNYLYLTIRQFQMEEIETVKVLRSLTEHVEAGKNYEFSFQYTPPIEDNLKSIFTNATLVHVEETDKVGLQQIQESINQGYY